ncbi:unnamed protein product [Nyctereutes procyonoides]|uniref:(raccoon dog) hypothetical protein n=1 Tax=Nyctereutes procyonoides TaxID=34880 RepID=A0A811XYN2_NYCPR|nr:unnamed protein product [Nyctereutes procyonoides]
MTEKFTFCTYQCIPHLFTTLSVCVGWLSLCIFFIFF